MNKKKWIVKNRAPQKFKEEYPDFDSVILDLLYQRDITKKNDIDQFLDPDYEQHVHDPFLFKDMQAAVKRANEAISANERIVVYGDYDADGLSAAVILVSTLKFLGATDVDVYLPDREKEGYGLNTDTINFLDNQNTRLLITCDCGVSNYKEVDEAKALGMDVIITDHHDEGNQLPNCIILHPRIEGETYPYKYLAGGGVAFKFAQALLHTAAKEHQDSKTFEAFEKWLLDMVAIASVADMVPLKGENRALVKYGLMVLSKARRVGVKAILIQAGLYPPKNGGDLHLGTHEVGFVIGPRLNAAGRMAHANAAYATLIEEDEETALSLAAELEKTNMERRQVSDQIFKAAIKQIGDISEYPTTLIAYDNTWPMGVVGLIAGKIMDKVHRPVFVLGEINGKIGGSGRSIEGYDCTQALQEVKDLLEKYGGHARACGFTLGDKNNFEDLKKRLNNFAKKVLTKEHLIPTIEIDSEIEIENVSWELYDNIKKFEPFGVGNPEPLFVSKNVEVVEANGCGNDNNHLRLSLTQDQKTFRKAIAFQQKYWVDNLKQGDRIDLVYTVDVNEWNGNRELQLKVVDIRMSYKQ